MFNYKLIKKEEAEKYFYKLPKHMQIESLNPRNNFLPEIKNLNS